MANKSVIAINVDDQQFKAFYELYKEFHANVEDMPEAWKQIGGSAIEAQQAMSGAASVLMGNLERAAGHASNLADHLKEAKEAQRAFALATGESDSAMKRLGKGAKELKETLFGIGGFLMKLGVLGVGSSIAGFFGMDKLAQFAVGTQRQARGLGMTTGQLQAFKTDYDRFGLDEGTLNTVANSRTDLSKMWAIQRALGGMPQDQIDRLDTGELTARLAQQAHDWWSSTPSNQHNEAFYQASGLPQAGISLDQARLLGNTSASELMRALVQYKGDRNRLGISDKSTDALYSFSRELEKTGRMLETSLANHLAPLGTGLELFTKRLGEDADALFNKILTPENLDKVEKGLEGVADYLVSDDFQKVLKEAGHDIAFLCTALFDAAKFIAHLFPDSGINVPSDPQAPATDKDGNVVQDSMDSHQAQGLGDRQANGGDTWINRYLLDRNDYYGGTSQANAIYGGPFYSTINPKTKEGKANLAYLGGLEKTLGLPEGLLEATIKVESSGVANAVSKKGAMGVMQLMPATAKQYGVTDPFDFNQNVLGGARLWKDLQKHYKGDIFKEAAAFNAGMGNIDKAVLAAHKAGRDGDTDFEDFLPTNTKAQKETRDYIVKVLKELSSYSREHGIPDPVAAQVQPGQSGTVTTKQQPARVQITVNNATGNNVAVSTNAGAAG